jgi:hypothetical protein
LRWPFIINANNHFASQRKSKKKGDFMRYGSGLRSEGRKKGCGVILIFGLLCAHQVFATASTQIWNPSTDIQKSGTAHIHVDNYFSIFKNIEKPFQIYPLIGVTAGVWKYLEVGIDMIQPTPDPFYFNFKLGLPESGSFPALAVGDSYIGTKRGVTDFHLAYGLAAKTLHPVGRLTIGYYHGFKEALFPDEAGRKVNTGVIATWDKAVSDKVWLCVDYASGQSWYGSLSFGTSYTFSSNVSVIFGYVIFNNSKVVPNNTFTTQLDVNL